MHMCPELDRPLIGVTCCIRESKFAKWTMDAAILPSTYTSAIERAGGIALLKGIRGRWDNDVKPEEMLGPGGDKKTSDEDKKDNS